MIPNAKEQNLQAVRRTLAMILPLADTFAFMFYERFFEMQPDARALFRGDMTRQRRKIVEMLSLALHGLEQPDGIDEALRRLGRRHANYGVRRQQYRQMNEAIVWALAETLGDRFTPELRQIWQQLLNYIATVMLSGEETPPPYREASSGESPATFHRPPE